MKRPIPLDPFIRLICEQTGIRVPSYQRQTLQKTLQQLASEQQLTSPTQLLGNLTLVPDQANVLWQQLINTITIGESHFFRDAARIDFLKKCYLPQLIQRKKNSGDLSLRIWSAGCAQGQELYTIAMLLEPLLGEQDNWQVDLIGTDINSDEITAALNAQYSPWSLRTMEPFYQRCYFQRTNHQQGAFYQLKQKIKNNCRFFALNLNDAQYSSAKNPLEAVDLILCCNVFIYFDPQSILPVLTKMADCLADKGALVMAAADYPYDLMAQHFELVSAEHSAESSTGHSTGQYNYFVKRPTPKNLTNNSLSENRLSSKPKPQSALESMPLSQSDNQSLIFAESDNQLKTALETPRKIESPTASPTPSSTASPTPSPAPSPAMATEPQVRQHMAAGHWAEAISAVKHYHHLHPHQLALLRYHANALANIGELAAVVEVCRHGLLLYPQDKVLYLLSALAYSGLAQLNEAQQALTNALFIDPAFIDGHYHQALLALKQGNDRQAEGCIQTILKLCKQRPEQEMTCLYPQTPMTAFKDTLQKENLKSKHE